jgi:hypothetical protein
MLSADETAVYGAVFSDAFQATSDTRILVADHTSIGVPPGLWTVTSVEGPDTSKFLAKLAPEARQDYQLKNKQSIRLPQPCRLAPQCSILDVVSLTAMVGGEKDKMEKGWKDFNRRYPTAPGIFVVSRIGFDHTHTQAVLYVAKSCSQLCGEGSYFWLVKRDGSWSVAAKTTVWIA